MSDQEIFLMKSLLKDGFLSNWHLNTTFLSFWDRFCQNCDYKKARSKFNYYLRKLYNKGFVEKPVKQKLNESGGYNEFGATTQTIWMIEQFYGKEMIESSLKRFDEN